MSDEILEDALCDVFDGLHICNLDRDHEGRHLCACGQEPHMFDGQEVSDG